MAGEGNKTQHRACPDLPVESLGLHGELFTTEEGLVKELTVLRRSGDLPVVIRRTDIVAWS